MMFNDVNSGNDLESRLAGVIEQDGITMVSPEGVRRRARKAKRTRSRPARNVVSDLAPAEAPDLPDRIEDLDVAAIGLLSDEVSSATERPVLIHRDDRPRSPFVLSLRRIRLAEQEASQEERFSWDACMASDHAPDAEETEAGVFGTLTQDLAIEPCDPRVFTDQFTCATFELACRSSYGRLHRVSQATRSIAADFGGLFKRVQRVERRTSEDGNTPAAILEMARLSPARALTGFVGLLFVITIPANAVTLYRSFLRTSEATAGTGTQAVQELLSAADGRRAPEVAASLTRASAHFREADAMLGESNALAVGLASVLPTTYRSARALLEAGDKVSQAGAILADGFDKVFGDPSRRLDERLDTLAAYAQGTLPLLSDASRAAASVKPDALPDDKRDQFVMLRRRLESAAESVRDLSGLAGLLSELVGKDRARSYLLVFQNHTELRPTGGFMGSVAEVTLDRGAVKTLRVPPGGTYDLKGQLLAHVVSPKPLHLINPHWQFQDANWFPDFPTSARKMLWFWSKSGQPTQDGVIAVNASFVERALEITGPIDMPAYGKVIDRNNFLLETQKAVELEYDRVANTPKKFIGDLADALVERMKALTKDEYLAVAALMSDALRTKDIQVYLTDEDEQRPAERYGWSGELKPTTGDSLAIIEANIAGQKTDGVIDEAVEHVAEIQPDGSIVDSVTLTRSHGGVKGELFRGVRNVSYVRLYVPLGSRLLETKGFRPPPPALFKRPDDDYGPDPLLASFEGDEETAGDATISTEGTRTVFGGWAQLDPGETQTLVYRYRLPFTVGDMHDRIEAGPGGSASDSARRSYTLLLSSQSGKSSRQIQTSVVLPSGWRTVWLRGFTPATGAIAWAGAWDQDTALAALLEEPSHEQEKTQ
ncbi:DUF4012 domain-containing protein [Candidatus Uhrbacteria bacterium]|nr:DUF4012 domain-containing protein [Candidatus Uhrbacteria bacterium]